jgi:UDP-glucuronate 4-epimerase
MKIFITGGAGFIGSHLIKKLTSQDKEIVIIDRLNSRNAELKKTRLNKFLKSCDYTFYDAELSDRQTIKKILKKHKFDLIIHFAATTNLEFNPELYNRTNILGTVNIFELAKQYKVPKVIFASSSMVYGNNPNPPFKESDNTDHPLSLYAATKKFDEVLAHTYHHLYGIEMVGLRFFTTYGPWGRPDMAISQFVERIIAGKKIQVHNQGQIKRDFTYVDDIVNGILSVINKKLKYELINLGSGTSISLKHIIELIEKQTDKTANIEYVHQQAGDLNETLADTTKAKKLLNYQPEYNIEAGLKKIYNLGIKPMKNNKAKVSACIIAYNHKKYIAEAIEGALMQELDCEYEIVISEDCSTDNTREIVKKYAEKYPDKIKLYLNEKNLGLIGNWEASLKRSTGEYIAILEGDDFWTDPKKIKKQINFLDNNPDYSLCSHNADVINESREKIRDYCDSKHPENINLEYLLTRGSGGPTCSLVIRNSCIQNLPDWFFQMHSCDWTIQIMAARHGKMKYFNEIMSTYRKHNQGANFSSKQNAIKKGLSDFALPAKYTLEMVKNLNKYFNYKYNKQLQQQSVYWYNWYVIEYLDIGEIKKAKKYAKKIFFILFPFQLLSFKLLNNKELTKILAIFFLPLFILKIIHGHRK